MRRISVQTSTLIVFVALGFQLLAAINNEGFHDQDEHLQLLDFRGQKAETGTGASVPDLQQKARPTLLAATASLTILGANQLGIASPYLQAGILRILSSALGLFVAFFVYRVFKRECSGETARNWLLSLLLLLWFMVFIRARFSPENWSGLLFFLGILWYYQDDLKEDVRCIIVGALLGLSFLIHFQAVFLILGFFLWLIVVEKEDPRVFITLIGGMASAALPGLLADRYMYGEWTCSPWNNLVGHLSGALPSHGVEAPWWFYIAEVARGGIYPLGAVVIGCTILFALLFRTHLLTWIAVPFLLIHVFMPHKELRFLYPLVSVLPVMIVLSIQRIGLLIRSQERRERLGRVFYTVIHPLWAINLVFLVLVSLFPASQYAPLYRHIYNEYGGHQVALLYQGEDPYGGTPGKRHFYKPAFLERASLASRVQSQELLNESTGKVLLLLNEFDIPASMRRHDLRFALAYQNMPEWAPVRIILSWFGRGRILTLYEVHREANRRVESPAKQTVTEQVKNGSAQEPL
jgi:phosphatidylinositol glycan class B